MFGFTATRAAPGATSSASAPGQKQNERKSSPLARTLKKLKKVVSFGRSKEKVSSRKEPCIQPQQNTGSHWQVALNPAALPGKPSPSKSKPLTPTLPTTKTNRSELSRAPARLDSPFLIPGTVFPLPPTHTPSSNPSNADRYNPGRKNVYTKAQAKAVVDAFIKKAQHDLGLAPNPAFTHDVVKDVQVRPASWDSQFEPEMAAFRYSATEEDIAKLAQVPVQKHWERVTGEVGRWEDESMIAAERYSATTGHIERVAQEPMQVEWERVTGQVGSWVWAYEKEMALFRRSATSEELTQLDLERREVARAHSFLKLIGGPK